MTYTWVYIVISGIGVLGLAGLVFGYVRQGTVKAALDTVALMHSRIEILNERESERDERDAEREAEMARMKTKMEVLEGLVTQIAPVRELAAKQAERHEENILFLTRLEGSLSRVESKIMRGE